MGLWVALAGIILQVIGVAMAVRGLAATYTEAVGYQSLWRDLWEVDRPRWWGRIAFWQKPEPQTIEVGPVDTMGATGSLGLFLTGRPPQPPTDATLEQQVDYLTKLIDAVADELVETRQTAKAEHRELQQYVSERIVEIREEVGPVQSEVRTVRKAAFGHDGGGLRRAVLGLCITGVGIALTAAGLPW